MSIIIDVEKLRGMVPVGKKVRLRGGEYTIYRREQDADIDISHDDTGLIAWHNRGNSYINYVDDHTDEANEILTEYLDGSHSSSQPDVVDKSTNEILRGDLVSAQIAEARYKGMVEVYERLISGGFTNLSK